MKEVIVLVGPAGVGKSTWAMNFIKHELQPFYYVNQDAHGKQGHKDLFSEFLAQDKNIIVDRMGFSKEQRARYLAPAKALGYKTRIVVLHEPRSVCYDRIVNRQGHQTIAAGDTKTAGKVLDFFFKNYERPTQDEADQVQFIWPQTNKIDCIVTDMDNTLSDASHREHYLNTPGQKKNWKGFFDAMSGDKVNKWCAEILRKFYSVSQSSEPRVLVVSARPDDYRDVTIKWMQDNDIPFDELIMRSRGDFREDSIVKEILYEFEIKTRYNVLFWLDDRKKVIDKMRSHDIMVLDCKGPDGDF